MASRSTATLMTVVSRIDIIAPSRTTAATTIVPRSRESFWADGDFMTVSCWSGGGRGDAGSDATRVTWGGGGGLRRRGWRGVLRADELLDPLAGDLPGGDVEPVPGVDRRYREHDGGQLVLVVVASGFVPDLVRNGVGAVGEAGHCPRQRGAGGGGGGDSRPLPPGGPPGDGLGGPPRGPAGAGGGGPAAAGAAR